MRTQAIWFALVLLTLAPHQRIGAQGGEAIDDPEAYAVYASLLPARFGTDDTDFTRVVLLEETRPKLSCLPTNLGPEWNEVVENYKTENARIRKLLPGFDVGLPYSLVAAADVEALAKESLAVMAAYEKARSSNLFNVRIPAPLRGGLPNGKIVSFSAVGFDESRTRALVSARYDCGFNCSGGWVVLREKSAGRWVQPTSDGTICTWTT